MSTHQTSTHSRTRSSRNSSARRPQGPGRRQSPNRLLLLVAVFVAIFGLLSFRVIQLQVFQHGLYSKISSSQVSQKITTTALRAGIYDRNGQILAVSRPTSLVIADDFQIKDPVQQAAVMTSIVKVPVEKLIPLLSKKSGYVVINGSLDLTSGRKLRSMYLPGIVVQDSSVRSYPNDQLALATLGGTNAAGAGSVGLEYAFQKLLAGQNGLTRELTSTSGVNLPSSRSTVIRAAKPGVGLELTLDTALQFVTERAVAKQLQSSGGVTGKAIVMDVKTGEILANVSLVNTKTNPGVLGPIPAWGKDIGVPGIQQTINNLPFAQAYEPGSVFKLVTFSAALQQGLVTPKTVFTVPNSVVVGTRFFHDAENHGTLHLTTTQILSQSSNIGTYKIGVLVGVNGLLAQVERMGFGQKTAINFPGETSGLLVNASTWYASDQVSLPIGQVDAVPPIQVLDAYNIIANNGVFIQPKLIRGFVNSNGSVKATAPSATRVALSPSVAQTINTMLQEVVLAGTGTNAIIPGYSVAGKTGTATIPYPGKAKLLIGQYNASFVGFAPANNPILSMIVIIERPQTSIFGGEVAAPIFQQVMSYALRHYGIPSNCAVQKPLTGKGAKISSDVT